MPKISAAELSAIIHGPGRQPTAQQAEVTEADPGSTLVVAGAGAGKTETMAARAVWLIANGYVAPDEVLGLTFTRKAAQELGRRIRGQCAALAASPVVRDLDPTGELATALNTRFPRTATYDSFAGDLLKEFGLLVPTEPDTRLITQAELFSIAHRVVLNHAGELRSGNATSSVVGNLLSLAENMGNEVVDLETVEERSLALRDTVDVLPKGENQKSVDGMTNNLRGYYETAEARVHYLPLVRELRQELRRLRVDTFNGRMSAAAQLARENDTLSATLRRRYRAVMLDEYQDTSHAQRILLSHLFGAPEAEVARDAELAVTAVGDPMQAIYGWRGATRENLELFVEDFPSSSGRAPKKSLTTSWRNPRLVLDVANRVSDEVAAAGPPREGVRETEPFVEKLEPRPGAPEGEVHLNYYRREEDEIEAVADMMAAQFHASRREERTFTGAVLVRKNAHSAPIAEALTRRDVPVEIVGTGGLLDVPEVADLVALATMLFRPGEDAAALRVLTGPMVGLGLKDLKALKTRARQLDRVNADGDVDSDTDSDAEQSTPAEDAVERLKQQLEAVTGSPEEARAGLGDAVADLGEAERYSEEGYRRLQRLSARLRQLRTRSLSKGLTELFIDIDTAFGIRTEVLSRSINPNSGAVHLDRFLEVAENFHGESLGAFLDYLVLSREHEDGLSPGEVTVRGDRVQIVTAHKAKGLEWECVAVLHVDAGTYKAKAETHFKQVKKIPSSEHVDSYGEAGDRKDFENAVNEWLAEAREDSAQENARLFYVAVTRTERFLSVSGSGSAGPYSYFSGVATHFPEAVGVWESGAADDEAQEKSGEGEGTKADPKGVGVFPQLSVAKEIRDAAQLVEEAKSELPKLQAGETYDFWEKEVDALIEEREALKAPFVDVELPGELTASDMVAIKRDPIHFARRQRRPVPFKPNSFAKRGTAFHEWLEERFGSDTLLSEDELPGMDEPVVHPDELQSLKEKFENSSWGQRQPVYVEHPFEIRLGSTFVRGRMDAVFRDSDGTWIVVDWKTGHFPLKDEQESAIIQLAVYREALRRQVGDDADIRAAFHYVAAERTFEPASLPDGAELATLLGNAVGTSED